MVTETSQRLRFALAAFGLAAFGTAAPGQAEPLPAALVEAAEQTLERAVAAFQEGAAVHGSYVWKVSPDGSFRAGEAKTDDQQGWAQPPGTPAIGLAYAAAYEATGEARYLDAALSAGRALADTQLLSGGWHALMEFDPERRRAWCYRKDRAVCDSEGPRFDNRDRDSALLDDDITQSALRLLIVLDGYGQDTPAIGEAAVYGLEKLVQAQYPNGAWPVNLGRRVGKEKRQAKVGERGRYPTAWSRTFTNPPTPEFFVLNDHLMSTVIRTLLLGHRHYGDGRLLQAAIRAGDFLLAAQMPPPQSGWAHVYNNHMEPIWGRRFEPPALVSWETATAVGVLMDLYRYTGMDRFWTAAEAAVAWLERTRIGDDRWARFYELETDKPLYMTGEYELTYDDGDLPAHYGFQGDFEIPAVLAAFEAMRAARKEGGLAALPTPAPEMVPGSEVLRIVETLDDRGHWIDDDMIRSAMFADHVETLADALASAGGRRIRTDLLFPPSPSW